jgi:hypothetical protein
VTGGHLDSGGASAIGLAAEDVRVSAAIRVLPRADHGASEVAQALPFQPNGSTSVTRSSRVHGRRFRV